MFFFIVLAPERQGSISVFSVFIRATTDRQLLTTFILEWTTRLDTSSRTLFVRENVSPDVHVMSNVVLRNNVRLLLNVELRNYVISRQIVI